MTAILYLLNVGCSAGQSALGKYYAKRGGGTLRFNLAKAAIGAILFLVSDTFLAAQLCGGLMNFFAGYGRQRGWSEFTVFDLATIMYLLYPERFEGFDGTCHVVPDGTYTRGMTVIDPCEGGHIHTLMKADKAFLNARFREAVELLDA